MRQSRVSLASARSIVGPARENLCDRVSTRAPIGRPRYRAGSLDRSVARTPSRGIARHNKAFGPGRRHRSGQQSAQKCSKAENPSAGRKASCRCSRATPRKSPNSAQPSSNRHHAFLAASSCQIRPFQNAPYRQPDTSACRMYLDSARIRREAFFAKASARRRLRKASAAARQLKRGLAPGAIAVPWPGGVASRLG